MKKLILISALLFSFNGWAQDPQLTITDELITDEKKFSTAHKAKSIADFFFFENKGVIHIVASQTGRELHMKLRGVSYDTANKMATSGDLGDAYLQLEEAIEEAIYDTQLKYSKVFEQKILEQFSNVEIHQFFKDLPKGELRKEFDYSDVDYDERLWSLYFDITSPSEDFLDDPIFMDSETMDNKEGHAIEFSMAIISNQNKFEEVFESALKEYENFFSSESTNAEPNATPCRFIKELCYDLESKKLFTGTYNSYQENGELSATGKLVYGRPEGVWKYFRYDGQLDHSWTFKKGIKNGIYEEFNSNGQLQTRNTWNMGRKTGAYQDFYDNGQLKSKGNLIDNLEDGLWKTFHENGQLKYRNKFKKGRDEGLGEKFYEGGQLQEKFNFRNGMREGAAEIFYENGQLEVKGYFKKDKQIGVDERFYDTGEPYWRRNFKNGELHGTWESFFKNGLTSVLSNWKRGKELKQTRFSYYEDDQLKSRGEFKDNKPNGLYESFYINGQLMHRGKVKDGVEVGVWEYFDEEGNLTKTEEYNNGKLIHDQET